MITLTGSALVKIAARSYSCVMLDLPSALKKKIRKLQAEIPEEILASEGVEQTPHITLKYGIHTKNMDEIVKVVKAFKPLGFQLGKLSSFRPRNKKHWVLKVAVEGADLTAANKALSGELETTTSYKGYSPHITLAYVKKGCRVPEINLEHLTGKKFSSRKVLISTPRGAKNNNKEVTLPK